MIVGPPIAGIADGIRSGFDKLGWNTTLLNSAALMRGGGFLERRVKRVVDPGLKSALEASFNSVLQDELLPLLHRKQKRPDLVLILKGRRLFPGVRDSLLEAQVPVFTWTYDSMELYPEQGSVIEIATHAFYFDRGDVPVGGKHTWLPHGYDDSVFFPRPGKKWIDILLFGRIDRSYMRRRQYLRQLAHSGLARRARCVFVGTTGNRLSDRLFRLGRHMEWISTRMRPRDLAALISASRVCINIHQDDGRQPMNLGFVAIPACRTCQVAEKRDYFSLLFEPQKEYQEFQENTFLETLDDVLADPTRCESIAELGLSRAVRSHTTLARAKTMVSVLDAGE